MGNSMSDEPFGVVFSGYRIINTCMLDERLGCFSTACGRRRPVSPDYHILCSWGLASTEKDVLLLSRQISLVFYGIWSSKSPEITKYWRLDLETAFSTGNSIDS